MTTTLTSVASAAIIGGDLIMGLSDGSIINCGRVQGPQGLTGDRGPMGATGRGGQDGRTILTVQGTPDTTLGKDGDFAINVVLWEIYGPRAGGVWGTGTPLRGNARGNQSPDTTQNLFGSNSPGSSGGGGIQQIEGGNGVIATPQSNPAVIEIAADIATEKGLQFDGGRIAINLGTGLEFDAVTGALKSAVNAADYAKITYVDQKTAPVPYRIETDKVLRDGKASTLSTTAEIQLVDNEDNFTNVKFTGLNGIGVTSDQQGITFDGSALIGDITVELDDYATKQYSDAKDQNLQNQIDDLEVQKGAAAIYTCKNTDAVPSPPFNPRPGQWGCDNAAAPNVTIIRLGAEDQAGALTKTIEDGDIIEINGIGGETRYKVTDSSSAPLVVAVEYISGNQGFVVDNDYTFYIYPQNEAGASKEYVDAQDDLRVVKSGDEMTGMLTIKPVADNFGLVVHPGPSASGVSDILRVRDYANNQVFYADVSGGVGVGNSWTPTSANHLIPKKYLEEYVEEHGGGDAKVPVQAGAPSGITVGSMWFDLTTNSLMIKVS